MQSQSQAILPGLIQRPGDAGLTKAPRTPGLQDFLRMISMGRCTWNLLFKKISAIINQANKEAKYFLEMSLVAALGGGLDRVGGDGLREEVSNLPP